MTRLPCICCQYFRDQPGPRCLADAPAAVGRLFPEAVWPCDLFTEDTGTEDDGDD